MSYTLRARSLHTLIHRIIIITSCTALAIGIGLVAAQVASPTWLLFGAVGIIATILLITFPEVTLALYLGAGSIKGDPRLSFLGSIDLTVALGALLVISLALKLVVKRQPIYIPRLYFLLALFVIGMLVSLFYTPDFAAGLDKTRRFVILTGIAILSPFAFLDSPRKLARFLWATVGRVLLVAIVSLSKLSVNTYDRLVSPSGDNLTVGYQSVTALAIFLFLIWIHASFRRKVILSPIPMVLILSLLGSGARGAVIAAGCCLCLSLLLSRKVIVDVVLIGLLGVVALSIVELPSASFRYLSQLLTQDVSNNLGDRIDSNVLAVRLACEHPLIGVGIGGYPSYAPAGSIYNYPHNVVLEVGAEMGIPAAAIVLSLIAATIWECTKQLMSRRFRYRTLAHLVSMLLVISCVNLSASGDINDNRPFWLYIGLPFLLIRFARQDGSTSHLTSTIRKRLTVAPREVLASEPQLHCSSLRHLWAFCIQMRGVHLPLSQLAYAVL